jgi:hypothetical protein
MALRKALLCVAAATCATISVAFAPPSSALIRSAAASRQAPLLRMSVEQESVNEKLFYDATTGRFYEKKVEEVSVGTSHTAAHLGGCLIPLRAIAARWKCKQLPPGLLAHSVHVSDFKEFRALSVQRAVRSHRCRRARPHLAHDACTRLSVLSTASGYNAAVVMLRCALCSSLELWAVSTMWTVHEHPAAIAYDNSCAAALQQRQRPLQQHHWRTAV